MSELGRLFIILGLFFNFIATVSLFRMPDFYTRLQSAARTVTLGTCSILMGVIISRGFDAVSFKVLFVMIFLILICPVCVHALTKGAYKCGKQLSEGSVCDRYKQDLINQEKDSEVKGK